MRRPRQTPNHVPFHPDFIATLRTIEHTLGKCIRQPSGGRHRGDIAFMGGMIAVLGEDYDQPALVSIGHGLILCTQAKVDQDAKEKLEWVRFLVQDYLEFIDIQKGD